MAVQFGDMRPRMGSGGRLAGNSHGDSFGVLFWRRGLTIGSCFRRVLAGLGSPVRSWKEKKLLLCAHKRRAGTKGVQIQTPALETVLRCACLDVHLQLTVWCLLDLLARMAAGLLCRC